MILGISRYFLLLLTLPMVMFSTGCVSTGTGPVTIDKVNPYHLQEGRIVKTEDRMLEFEHRRHLWGAVENSERRDLMGNYFTIFWKTSTKNPVTVRFEYRQGSTGFDIKTQEEYVASPKRSNVTKFQVIGDDYWDSGKVTQWKASIIENGTVMAEYKSFLWK
ncbi:MAG: hypothetical protein CMO55_22280 [Verrucomicrobiales bacterium]|nr:hypothetical protein [Verrucomicrobiales bacterium]